MLSQQEELTIHGCSRRDPGIDDLRFHYYNIDLSETASLGKNASHFFKVKPGELKRLILINNAGMLGNAAFVGEQQAEHYISTFTVNTLAPIIFLKCSLSFFSTLNLKE